MVSEYGLDWSAGVNYSCEKYTFGTSEHYYHADIDGGNITENAEFPIIDDWLGLYYGDYQTETADGAIVLRDMQSGETVPVLSRAETLDYSAIVGDILYYCPNFRNYRMNESGNIVSKNTLCGIDLSTGESFTVAKTAYMTDYAIVGDTAYICGGLNFSVEPSLIKAALQKAAEESAALTDDCAAVERLGMTVCLTRGSDENIKITTPADLNLGLGILNGRGELV